MTLILTIILLNLSFRGSIAHKMKGDKLHVHGKNQKAQISNISRFPSIQTVHGDIYDCIDVHKQHSLSHPALRNHKIKMKPRRELIATFPYMGNRSKSNVNLVKFNPERLWKSKKGCPKGTVPIRRTTKISDQKSLRISRDYLSQSLKERYHGIDFAGIYSKPGKTFYAAAANINLHNPKVNSDQEYSSSTMFIRSGESLFLEQIQVGWTVNPQLYGDYHTRLYTRWTTDNHQTTGCFNTQCPGFVMVNNNIPLDYVFPNTDISVFEGKQWDLAINVFLEPGVCWWLAVSDPSIHIGYWPISLFTTMQESADSVRFGGEVFTPLCEDNSPQMGSGRFVNGQYDKSCYIRRIMVTDETRVSIDVNNSFIDVTDSRCYYEGDHSFKNENDRYSFVFGGAGGKDKLTCIY